MKKLAIISHALPSAPNVQSAMLARLLGDRPPSSYCLVTSERRRGARVTSPADAAGVHHVPMPWLLRKARRLSWCRAAVFHAAVRQRGDAIARVVEREQCQAMIGCTGGDLVDVPATVHAARLTGMAAYLYYFDDYALQWQVGTLGWGGRFGEQCRDNLERDLAADVAGIIVPNESLATELRGRLPFAPPLAVVRNPIDRDRIAALRAGVAPAEDRPGDPRRERRVVYTGSVYSAQHDAILNVAAAVDRLRRAGRNVALHIYTGQKAAVTESMPSSGAVQVHEAVSADAAVRIQAAADVLLLPLSFNCEYPGLIRTSAPGKLGEYLASGQPVLVHAPEDSFLAQFARTRGCAAVCPTPEAGQLADALVRLLDDPGARRAVVDRALETSKLFGLSVNRDRFFGFVEGEGRTARSITAAA